MRDDIVTHVTSGNQVKMFQRKRERTRWEEIVEKRRDYRRFRQRLSSFYCVLERKNNVMLTCMQDTRPPRGFFVRLIIIIILCTTSGEGYRLVSETESLPVATVAGIVDKRKRERDGEKGSVVAINVLI